MSWSCLIWPTDFQTILINTESWIELKMAWPNTSYSLVKTIFLDLWEWAQIQLTFESWTGIIWFHSEANCYIWSWFKIQWKLQYFALKGKHQNTCICFILVLVVVKVVVVWKNGKKIEWMLNYLQFSLFSLINFNWGHHHDILKYVPFTAEITVTLLSVMTKNTVQQPPDCPAKQKIPYFNINTSKISFKKMLLLFQVFFWTCTSDMVY